MFATLGVVPRGQPKPHHLLTSFATGGFFFGSNSYVPILSKKKENENE